MKTTLLLIGRTTDAHIQALIDQYCKRLSHYLTFDIVIIPELKNNKNLSQEQQKEAEGKLILQNVEDNATLVLLDEHGTEYRSIEFADRMQRFMSAGRNIVFVVGGPYGFSQVVYQRANHKISLSKMTFSHQMIRLIFIEQLYRAMTILRGEPYHHE